MSVTFGAEEDGAIASTLGEVCIACIAIVILQIVLDLLVSFLTRSHHH